jgi:hypothetical protein
MKHVFDEGNDAFKEGETAYRLGADRLANPYSLNWVKRATWAQGWENAHDRKLASYQPRNPS